MQFVYFALIKILILKLIKNSTMFMWLIRHTIINTSKLVKNSFNFQLNPLPKT